MDNTNTNLGRSSWLRWGEWGAGRIDLFKYKFWICKNHQGEDNEETWNWPIAKGWAADTGCGTVLPCAHLLQVPSQHMFTLHCFLAKLHVCNSSTLRRPYIMELRQVSWQELCRVRLNTSSVLPHISIRSLPSPIAFILLCVSVGRICGDDLVISCEDLLLLCGIAP